MRRNRLALLLLLAACALVGCGGASSSGPPVYALVAASTKDAVEEIAADFTRTTGVEVRVTADDSSRLAAQIVNGAPADLFLSANVKWADHVRDQGLATDSTVLLGNTLVLIVPKDNPGHVQTPADLATPHVQRVALAGPNVPAGIYARRALTALQLLEPLERKIVAGENVRATLAYVERGEVEAGVVYGTDARISDRVAVVYTFDLPAEEPIRYPLVLLKDGAPKAGARQFYDHLRGPEAAAVFRRCGFLTPPPGL